VKNAALGRKILDKFDQGYGEMMYWGQPGAPNECGTAACLGGWAMILSGYTLAGPDCYRRPDGTTVPGSYADEAQMLLGMTTGEAQAGNEDGISVWFDFEDGPDRFRKLVEESEGKQQDLWTGPTRSAGRVRTPIPRSGKSGSPKPGR